MMPTSKAALCFRVFGRFVDRKHLDGVIAQFEQAVQIDPTYAPPYAALSVAYQTSTQTSFVPPKDSFPKARAAALKALELDDQLAEAHAALGGVLLWYDWNWSAAEREIQRALQLNPDSVDALTTSETSAMLANARFDEAERTSQRILSLDPLNPFARIQRVWVSAFSRRQDDAIRRAKSLLELFPEAWFGNSMLAFNYAVKHMSPEVGAECAKVMERLNGAYDMQGIGMCVWALGVVGQTDEARRLLQIVEHPPAGLWLDPVVMGSAYGGLGDLDRAFAWYEKGIEERAPNMLYMNTGAPWDPARGDPRFQTLLRRMNFPGRASP